MSKQRLVITISGRVQGVGFRDFARREARQLNVTGWVRNEPDGSVCVEAEGDLEAIDKLIAALHEGPRMARVENVEAHKSDDGDAFDGFSVRY